MSAKKIPGKVTPMSKEAFEAKNKGRVHSSCQLKDVVTFYFVFEGGAERLFPVFLYFYNDALQQMHSSPSWLLTCLGLPRRSVALNEVTFLFTEDLRYTGAGRLLCLDANWGVISYEVVSQDTTREMAIMYMHLPQTSIQRIGLASVRYGSEGDFSLKSEDGEEIKVHKMVMVAVWPFFKKLMEAGMKEAETNEVDFPMPASTLKDIVSYLYGEDICLSFERASSLIVFAQMYDLPELLDMAISRVKLNLKMTTPEAVDLWHKFSQAGNSEMKEYAATWLSKLMPNNTNFNEEIKDLEKDELVALLQDLCLAMGK